MNRLYPALFALIMLFSYQTMACTSIAIEGKNGLLLGQNYDFAYEHGAVFVNPSKLQKISLHNPPETPIKWLAKYASISFSQFGMELPTSGMNEQGLMVQMLWDEDNPIPKQTKESPALNELQFVQFILDSYSSLEEVKKAVAEVKIRKSYADLHYVVCDKSQCALLEFNGEKLEFLTNQYAPYVITNKSLANSQGFYQAIQKNKENISDEKKALPAYARAVRQHEHLSANKSANQESLLESLTQTKADYEFMDIYNWIVKSRPPSVTAWSAVYDSANLKVYWRNKENEQTKVIDFTKLARSCEKPYLALSLNEEYKTQDVTSKFSEAKVHTENTRIIRASYEPIEDEFPKGVQDELIEYPKQLKCQQSEAPSSKTETAN